MGEYAGGHKRGVSSMGLLESRGDDTRGRDKGGDGVVEGSGGEAGVEWVSLAHQITGKLRVMAVADVALQVLRPPVSSSVLSLGLSGSGAYPYLGLVGVAMARLGCEVRLLARRPLAGVEAWPSAPPSLFRWTAVFQGPRGTPWDGGRYTLHIEIPEEYPRLPPFNLRFASRMFHPNISPQGIPCLDLLESFRIAGPTSRLQTFEIPFEPQQQSLRSTRSQLIDSRQGSLEASSSPGIRPVARSTSLPSDPSEVEKALPPLSVPQQMVDRRHSGGGEEFAEHVAGKCSRSSSDRGGERGEALKGKGTGEEEKREGGGGTKTAKTEGGGLSSEAIWKKITNQRESGSSAVNLNPGKTEPRKGMQGFSKNLSRDQLFSDENSDNRSQHFSKQSAVPRWTPYHGLVSVLISVQHLFFEVNTDRPINLEAAAVFRNDQEAWRKAVEECAKESLKNVPSPLSAGIKQEGGNRLGKFV